MQVIVCQIGARHRYAVPRMLEEEGCLAAFYCDGCAANPIIKHGWLMQRFFPRVGERQVIGVAGHKIHSTLLPNLFLKAVGLLHKPLTSDDFFAQGKLFSRWIARQKRPAADWLITYGRLNSELAELWRGRGIKNAVDVIISPLTEEIMAEEIRINPQWSAGLVGNYSPERIVKERNHWLKTLAVADILLCPSQWVADGILKISPEARPKIRLVPYGCSIDYGSRVNQPVPGKVIFCGNEPLRKGLAYLAEAALMLKQSNPEIQIEVIGAIDPEICRDPRCAALKFVGKLSRQQMIEMYLSADVFVLPSLSEGFAGVVAEAVTAGLPCVVTPESGSGIVDGHDGLIVESRSAAAIAAAVRKIVVDRDLRGQMSAACLAQRPFYSAQAWKERLMNALRSV